MYDSAFLRPLLEGFVLVVYHRHFGLVLDEIDLTLFRESVKETNKIIRAIIASNRYRSFEIREYNIVWFLSFFRNIVPMCNISHHTRNAGFVGIIFMRNMFEVECSRYILKSFKALRVNVC
jgi:hypothetical protein